MTPYDVKVRAKHAVQFLACDGPRNETQWRRVIERAIMDDRDSCARESRDSRPQTCRFRLQDEGKPYPKSACVACGKTIATGLGKSCTAYDLAADGEQP